MNNFDIGDSVKVICQCDIRWCKDDHNKVGVIYHIDKFPHTTLYAIQLENGDVYYFNKHNLTPLIKQVIKKELKGLLE